jgi:hypothetical protein
LLGVAFSILNQKTTIDENLVLVFASSIKAIYFVLFSGIMIGVGTAIFFNGMILTFRGNRPHIFLSLILFLISIFFASIVLLNENTNNLINILIFFASLSSAVSFFLFTVIYVFSALLKRYLKKEE